MYIIYWENCLRKSNTNTREHINLAHYLCMYMLLALHDLAYEKCKDLASYTYGCTLWSK